MQTRPSFEKGIFEGMSEEDRQEALPHLQRIARLANAYGKQIEAGGNGVWDIIDQIFLEAHDLSVIGIRDKIWYGERIINARQKRSLENGNV